ncbi:hypothetical protein Plec18167_001575 [Paecilomyces lecythidis]|uniref:RING-type domain-containing protein n=1 Tax=Paecilomyces lecythidis TaxID=3004212 RepID=A0ABR3Y9F4_9EURO
MSLYSASSSSPYDLGSILQLYPEDEPTCVGFAVTQGRRCRCRIHQLNRQKACSFLERGTRDLEQGRNITGLLEQLAPLVLCKQFHQSQQYNLASRWEQEVEDFRRRQDQVSSTSTTPVRNNRLLSSSPFSSSSSPSTLAYSEGRNYRRHGSPDEVCNAQRMADILQRMNDRLERMVEILEDSGETPARQRENAIVPVADRDTQREESTISARPAISRSASRTVEPDNTSVEGSSASASTERTAERTSDTTSEMRPSASSATGATPFTIAPASSSRRTSSSSSPVTVSLVRVPEIDFNMTIPTSTTTAISTTTARRTVTQKPVEGDCSICANPLIHIHAAHEDHSTEHIATENENENEPSRLSWCKAQCGNNYHKECIDQWVSTCESMSRNPTCPFCRAQWVE